MRCNNKKTMLLCNHRRSNNADRRRKRRARLLNFQVDQNRIFKAVPITEEVAIAVHITTAVKRAIFHAIAPNNETIPIHWQENSQNFSHIHHRRERPRHLLLDKLQTGRT